MGFLLLARSPGLKQGIHLVFPNTPLPSQQGEKILKLAEICRKFETEEEKVLPFYSSALTPTEQEEVERQNQEDLTEELAKVRTGRVRAGQHLLKGTTALLFPLPPRSGYGGLLRDGELLEKIQ